MRDRSTSLWSSATGRDEAAARGARVTWFIATLPNTLSIILQKRHDRRSYKRGRQQYILENAARRRVTHDDHVIRKKIGISVSAAADHGEIIQRRIPLVAHRPENHDGIQLRKFGRTPCVRHGTQESHLPEH